MAVPPAVPPAVPAAPAQDQIEFTATRLSVVTVRGVSYQFSVTGSISGKRCDELVRNHIELLLTASGKNSFDSIKSVIKPGSIGSPTRFTVESNQVEYLSKKGAKKKKDAWQKYVVPMQNNSQGSPEIREKVSRFWEASQRSFVELTSGAPSPAELAAPQVNPAQAHQSPHSPAQLVEPVNGGPSPVQMGPQQPIQPAAAIPVPPANNGEDQFITAYRNAAQAQMRLPPVKVDEALAHQISQMALGQDTQGDKDYKGKTIQEIKRTLRKKYIDYININSAEYSSARQPTKFLEILENLRNALKAEKGLLTQACNNCNSNDLGNYFSKTNISFEILETLLFEQPAQNNNNPRSPLEIFNEFRANDINGLIKIHAEYININGTCLNENSFLEAFVKIHNRQGDSNPNMFQVLVVTNSPDTTPRHLCPRDRGNIFENRCALLFRDATGGYRSLVRRQRASVATSTSGAATPNSNSQLLPKQCWIGSASRSRSP